jgi:hypothetical protein
VFQTGKLETLRNPNSNDFFHSETVILSEHRKNRDSRKRTYITNTAANKDITASNNVDANKATANKEEAANNDIAQNSATANQDALKDKHLL